MSKRKEYIRKGYNVTERGRLEHRLVYERAYGRLPKNWVVHHVNGQKNDNRLENLIGLPTLLHDRVHAIQREMQVRFTKVELESVLRELVNSIALTQLRLDELEKEQKDLADQRDQFIRTKLQHLGCFATRIGEAEIPRNRPTFLPKVKLRKRCQ